MLGAAFLLFGRLQKKQAAKILAARNWSLFGQHPIFRVYYVARLQRAVLGGTLTQGGARFQRGLPWAGMFCAFSASAALRPRCQVRLVQLVRVANTDG